jgi:pyruvate,water dikinase
LSTKARWISVVREESRSNAMPDLPVKIMMNVGNPDRAFDFCGLPQRGVGLARLEFIINRMIGIHPRALLNYDSLSADLKHHRPALIAAYASPREFFIDALIEGHRHHRRRRSRRSR